MTEQKPTYRVDNRPDSRDLSFIGTDATAKIDGQEPPIQDKLHYLLRSRKFWASIVGLAVVIIGSRAGVDDQELTSAVLTIVAYILGTALEDGLARS
jgi:hypothetical protein